MQPASDQPMLKVKIEEKKPKQSLKRIKAENVLIYIKLTTLR